jgi:hypothetical protein
MALTIANWTISVRLHRAPSTPATQAADPTTDQLRRQASRDISRQREQAHTRWMLLGGNVNR